MESNKATLVKRTVSVSLTALIATQLQIGFFFMALIILQGAEPYLITFFGIVFEYGSNICQDSFNVFYLVSFGLLITNILLCVGLSRIFKANLHFSLLISMLILSVALSQFLADRGGGIINFDWHLDFYFTVPHVLAFAQFAVYCIAIQLLNKKCIWNERWRTLVSSGIALLLGRFTSWLAWLIMYNIYTG